MTAPRKIELGPLAGHPGVTVAALHAPGALSGTYAVQLAPGASVPAHAHPNAETIIAYESLAVTVGDTEYWLSKGHAIDIPPGVEHRIENPRVLPADYISIATPPWEGAPAMLVPASVAEALATLPPREDPFGDLFEAAETLDEVIDLEGKEDITDAIAATKLAPAIALTLRALAKLEHRT